MNLTALQTALSAYLVGWDDDDPGYRLPGSVILKPFGEDGIVATSGMPDHRQESLQLYISGSDDHYIISDHGYIRTEIVLLGDDTDIHRFGHDTDELLARYLDREPYRHLREMNGQIICQASDADFAQRLTAFFRLLWELTRAIRHHLDPPCEFDDAYEEYDRDENDAFLDRVYFVYQGRPLSGSDLIPILPRDTKLRAAFDRFCELRLDAMLGMSMRKAHAYARAQIETELEAQANS